MNWHERSNSDGDWQNGDAPLHARRFKIIAELLTKFGAAGHVLDVGCGVGELAHHLTGSNYVGLERSESACAAALERDPGLNIIQTSAEEFDLTGERFDSVVFNEMLYYAGDPVGLVEKYAHFLAPGGIILCSVFQKKGRASLRRLARFCLDRRCPISNIHCEKIVRAHMARAHWMILEDRNLAVPLAPNNFWHIWVSRPQPSQCQ